MNITNKPILIKKTSHTIDEIHTGNPRTISLEMIWYMRNLHDKYGEDIVKMTRDVKLNYMQYSKKKLQHLLKQYLENETKLRVEEEVGNIDEFDGKTNVDRELDNIEDELKQMGLDLDDVSSDDEMTKKIMEECGIPDVSSEDNDEDDEDENE